MTFYPAARLGAGPRRQGLGSVIVAAMNQSFFTLSLGIGAMEIFGSYMSKRDHSLAGEAVRICVPGYLCGAVMSGLIIFPACFTFGIAPDSGPQPDLP